MAIRTCEGSRLPEVQADPVEAAIPLRSRYKIKDSPSINSKETFKVLGSLRVGCPFSRQWFIFSLIIFSNLSRRLDSRRDCCTISFDAISAAFPSPTMPATSFLISTMN